MKILFLHGWHSVPGGLKPSYLIQNGHEVINPALDDDDLDEAVRTAQAEYDRLRPDVIVGSSRGGAVAMNLDSGSSPLVLLCPAWKRWGTATRLKPGTVVLHSEADDVIPIAHSRELVRASGLPESALIVVGTDHRLADPEPLKAMLEACERAARSAAPAPTANQAPMAEAAGARAAAVADDHEVSSEDRDEQRSEP
jgi:alpha-beta hydrolase superfamily lysophospholipase